MHVVHNVWEGVYGTFAEAGGDLDAFDSDIWINKIRGKLYNALNDYQNKNCFSRDYPLSLAAAMLLGNKDSLSILDFGGGMGFQYLELLAKVASAKEKVTYCIVDGKATLDALPSEMKMYQNLHFSTSLDTFKKSFDVVHIGSTLQYIEDWQGLLQDLVQNCKPKYFVFSDLLAGDIPEFVTNQIFYEKRIPVKMLNLSDLENVLQSLSFKIIFKTLFETNICGQTEFLNKSLPEKLRLKNSCNLIFSLLE